MAIVFSLPIKWLLLLTAVFFQYAFPSSAAAISTVPKNEYDAGINIKMACEGTTHVDLCVRSLKSDARSFTADHHGLARISIELALAKGNGVSLHVLQLLNGTSDDVTATDLTECARRYDNIVHMVGDSLQAFDSQSYVLARFQLSSCVFDASMCEEVFAEEPEWRSTSPLGDANDIMGGLCVISSELIQLLLNG